MVLRVRILSDVFILDMIFVINFGNNWISVEMDFFVVNEMKVWMIIIIIYYFNEELEIEFEYKNCLLNVCEDIVYKFVN